MLSIQDTVPVQCLSSEQRQICIAQVQVPAGYNSRITKEVSVTVGPGAINTTGLDASQISCNFFSLLLTSIFQPTFAFPEHLCLRVSPGLSACNLISDNISLVILIFLIEKVTKLASTHLYSTAVDNLISYLNPHFDLDSWKA